MSQKTNSTIIINNNNEITISLLTNNSNITTTYHAVVTVKCDGYGVINFNIVPPRTLMLSPKMALDYAQDIISCIKGGKVTVQK